MLTRTHTSRINYLNALIHIVGFIVIVTFAALLYHYIFHDVLKTKHHYFLYFLAGWVFLAYLILPFLYRIVARFYLPRTFTGRTQLGDGVLGDPVNIAIIGSKGELIKAMRDSGWTPADQLTLMSALKMIYSAVFSAPYPSAPVSGLYLFNKKQDLAFEKDVNGNPRRRHHVRFWRVPDGWWLTGGYKVDWLGAATFDTNVSLSLFTGQITHKIDANVDTERDFVVSSLTNEHASVSWVEHFTSSYKARNGGGDAIHTDGAMPFVKLRK